MVLIVLTFASSKGKDGMRKVYIYANINTCVYKHVTLYMISIDNVLYVTLLWCKIIYYVT